MITKLYQLIREAATRLPGEWVILFANQNAPRPVKPYITINVLNVDIPDHVIYSAVEPAEDLYQQTISGWRIADVELQIYNGIDSLDTVNSLALILQTVALIEYQQTIDVAIGQRLFIGYVPELLNESQYEGRGIYQFKFMYTETYNEIISIIDTVTLGGDCTETITTLP